VFVANIAEALLDSIQGEKERKEKVDLAEKGTVCSPLEERRYFLRLGTCKWR
jgi:hypothetical protein